MDIDVLCFTGFRGVRDVTQVMAFMKIFLLLFVLCCFVHSLSMVCSHSLNKKKHNSGFTGFIIKTVLLSLPVNSCGLCLYKTA